MTADQCRMVVTMFPDAAYKVKRLDVNEDIPAPEGKDLAEFVGLAGLLYRLIEKRLDELNPAAAG
jgi:hypothetical protein